MKKKWNIRVEPAHYMPKQTRVRWFTDFANEPISGLNEKDNPYVLNLHSPIDFSFACVNYRYMEGVVLRLRDKCLEYIFYRYWFGRSSRCQSISTYLCTIKYCFTATFKFLMCNSSSTYICIMFRMIPAQSTLSSWEWS